MPSIEKLMLRGIRSYNPTNPTTLNFKTPLTLLLGPNGSGKTTIIESLKYVTTGSLPPHNSFVYDPRLIKEVETRAQIKLKFKSTKNQKMVVTRTLQLTHKKTKSEQRTLESVLWTDVDGTQTSISGKCTQIDKEVPYFLGTTPAALEHIVFVAQDQANWIFEDPKTVKKKMDDLFENNKISKAIEQLKNLKKIFATDYKIKKQAHEFLQKEKLRNDEIRTLKSHNKRNLEFLMIEYKHFQPKLINLIPFNWKLKSKLENWSWSKLHK